MLSHRKGVLLDGIGSELVRSSAGGRRKTLSSWLGAAGDMTVTATGSSTARTLADWFQGMERGTVVPPLSDGYFTDRETNGDLANPFRIRDRVFIGDGADEDGTTVPATTWLSDDFEPYFARSAQLLVMSPSGGAGGVFATRTTDCYDGNPVWTTGEAVTAGAKRGYLNSAGARTIYTATTSGTTGATPPTHTTGSVSDGGVTWSYTQVAFRTPMSMASLAWNDAADGGAAWANYIEAVRGAGAGDTTVLEIDIQNAGSNVNIHPYSMFSSGLSVALWLACQQNVYGPAATNPSTAAIGIIGRAGEANYRFNKGIVFHSESLTDEGGGVYRAINLFEDCYITQYVSGGVVGSAINFTVSANNERVAQVFANRAIQFQCQGAVMGVFESSPAAGTAPENYVTLSAHAASDGLVQIRPAGATTDVKLSLRSKGAEDVHILREDSSTDTAPHVLSVKRRSTGTPATGIGAALTFDVETGVGNDEIGAIIEAVTTDVTSTSEDFDLVFKTMAAGATAAERARLNDRGLFVGSRALWRPIASSAVQIVRNSVNGAGDATETAQVTVAIPAGAMGANGRLRITFLGTCTNSANGKSWIIRYGASGAGTGGQAYYSVAATNQASTQVQLMIRNRNSASSQVGYSTAVAASFGQTTNAVKTSAINSAAATELVISNAWAGATSGEAMNVEDYLVEVLYQA